MNAVILVMITNVLLLVFNVLPGRVVFSKNPVWYHDENDYSTAKFVNDYTDNPAFPRKFVALEVVLRITRAGRGILVISSVGV